MHDRELFIWVRVQIAMVPVDAAHGRDCLHVDSAMPMAGGAHIVFERHVIRRGSPRRPCSPRPRTNPHRDRAHCRVDEID